MQDENLHVVTVHSANKEIAGFPLNIIPFCMAAELWYIQ